LCGQPDRKTLSKHHGLRLEKGENSGQPVGAALRRTTVEGQNLFLGDQQDEHCRIEALWWHNSFRAAIQTIAMVM
jgi:hypothetical protein